FPCCCTRVFFPWQGRRCQALYYHLDGFLHTRKDGPLVQKFYFGLAGVDIDVQKGGRQRDPQRRHRMTPRWQESPIGLLQGSTHQGTTHGAAVHPVTLPLPCGAVERRWTHGT